MREQDTEPFNAAEARLAARMQRWSDQGVVAIDAAEIARQAATAPSSGTTRGPVARSSVGSRRVVLILAALLVVGLVVALAAATLLRTPNPADAYRAVAIRAVDRGVDVVVVAADGSERVLRHVTPEGLGIDVRYQIASANLGQSVSRQGWLELSAYAGDTADRTGLARWGLTILVDLADPARPPIMVPGNGFMSGRWGPDGRWAHFCGADCDQAADLYTQATEDRPFTGASTPIDRGQVRVLDLDRGLGSEVIVSSVRTFGGGPDIFWAADGSGFLAQRGTEWGVTPLDGGPFIPGLPKLLDRGQYATTPGLDEQYATTLGLDALAEYLNEDWYVTDYAWATSVDVQRSADWATVWQSLADTDRPSPQAVLARLTGPAAVESVHAFAVPERLNWAIWSVEGQQGSFRPPWFSLAPDDTYVALGIEGRFVLAPLTPGDQAAATGPVIEGDLAGLVPAAAADTWPGR